MKNWTKTLMTGTVMFCMAACSPMSKESYLKKYDAFISEVTAHYNSYDDKAWAKQSEQYEKFSGQWYDKFKEKFTLKEQIAVKANQVKWYYFRNLNNTAATVKQLLDTLDVQGMKKQVQYYIDNNMQSDLQTFYEEAQKRGKDAREAVTEILKELNVKTDELQK